MEQKIHLYQMFNHAAQVCKNEEEKNEKKLDVDTNSMSIHEYLLKLENRP